MNKPQPPGFRGPYRRRRIIWFLLSVTAIGLFYLSRHPDSSIFGSWSLPAYLKDIGLSNSSSSARLVSDAKLQAGKPRVQEIDGLLHFVIAYPDRRLNEEGDEIAVKGLGSVRVDPEEPVDLKVYSPNGDGDWEQHVKNLRDNHPLVVFSKTYCPYSKRAKALLESYNLSPPPTIVELDTRSDGAIIQTILGRLTGRRTVPNVLLQGGSIGGSDDLALLDEQQKLVSLLEGEGLKANI
ncbi:hypothetical protein PHLCEN_2v7091 [Hermanssonia centrifuga]|uniref:Glutaredoxin domain-containing protein n=1 Tax=Hermanssonia centrifuga TaxID=98765 RepID=A0A2R6NY49_9APHY|nr:hypothetical protein PHLCEN_2v7091 [Hermanssonia centrifuga]